MNRIILSLVALLLVVAGAPLVAAATIGDFSTLAPSPGGNLGLSTLTDSGIVIDAFSVSGGHYTQTNTTIFVRVGGSNDTGLGVCSPGEQSSSDCKAVGSFTGGGGRSTSSTMPESAS